MKGTHMKQLKFILPLLLATITLLIYRPIQAQANNTNYEIIFVNESYIDHADGDIFPASSRARTNKIQIISNSLDINNLQFISYISFWDNNTYLGYYGSYQTPQKLGNLNDFQIPNNATHFAFTIATTISSVWTPSNISFSNFQTVTASYTTPAPVVPEGSVALTWSNIEGTVHQRSNGALQTIAGNRTTSIEIPSNQITLSDYMLVAHISLFNANNDFLGTLYNTDRWLDPQDRNFSNLGVFNSNNITIPSSPNLNVSYIVFNNYYDSISTIMVGRSQAQFNQLTATGTIQGLYYVFYANHDGSVQEQFGPYQEGDTFDHTQEAITQLGNALNREGFEFDGVFDGPNVMGTNNFVKYALYTQLTQYTVVFQDWNGTVLGTDTVVEGFPATAPVIPTRTGYTFVGWLPPIATITGDITTVAQYEANTYLVSWTSDDIEVKATQVAHDSVILDHAPFVTYEGYVFIGWKIEPTETLVTSGQLVTGPLSLTAVWEQATTYTVIWRDPSFNTLKIEYVIESGLATAPNYDPGSGLVLVGWNPNPTQPITENTTFIAVVQSAPTQPTQPIPANYSPISDLFGGVIGASIGAVMTLGTIDLYGIQLSSIIYLFISMSLGLWILKAIRG